MPLYDYYCENCGNTVEKLQLGECVTNPECCGLTMRRLPSTPAFIKIKGEGGYPSRRKMVNGSAPGTTRATKVWGQHDPSKNIKYM
jgi:putative FmdB family regulatory protein